MLVRGDTVLQSTQQVQGVVGRFDGPGDFAIRAAPGSRYADRKHQAHHRHRWQSQDRCQRRTSANPAACPRAGALATGHCRGEKPRPTITGPFPAISGKGSSRKPACALMAVSEPHRPGSLRPTVMGCSTWPGMFGNPSVIQAYEARIEKLERQKIRLTEQAAQIVPPRGRLGDVIEHAMTFLSSRWIL